MTTIMTPRPAAAPDYSRQIALREVGAEGQARLRGASVLVVGAGGLGVPVLQYLAGAGVGRLGIVDADRLEPSNLHRQTWYALADCGREKSTLAAERVRALNPEVRVEPHALRLDAGNAERLAAGHDLILDCSDNFATKFLLNDLALRTAQAGAVRERVPVRRPAAAGARRRRHGLPALRVARGHARRPGGQLRRSRRARPRARRVRQPAGARGAQAVVRPARPRARRDADLRSGQPEHAAPARAARAGLRRASARRRSPSPPPRRAELEVQFASLAEAQRAGFTFVDVRDARERADEPLPSPALHLPMSKLLTDAATLDADGRYLLICATGKRSAAAADLLRSQGFRECRSLRGGLKGLKASA